MKLKYSTKPNSDRYRSSVTFLSAQYFGVHKFASHVTIIFPLDNRKLQCRHIGDGTKVSILRLVYRLLNPLSFVAFKMGRLRGGPSRTGAKGAYLDRYVTDEQRSSRPIFNATFRAAAGWLFFRVARSTRMTQIWAFRSRLEKQISRFSQPCQYANQSRT